MGKKKKDGQIFTPEPIVRHMLYDILLKKESIINKHIIDNSCGDGAFLCAIAKLLFQQLIFWDNDSIRKYMETYVHGIELDPIEYKNCLDNLNNVAKEWGVTGIKWDIQNRDALSCHDYDGKMDYVVANPPYIRVHDLECDLSGYSFADEGMTDLYLAFYELGFRMLNETGRMCYIAPSSWFTSGAGQKLRDYVAENKYLKLVEDYGHIQLFENATTYVAIELFTKNENNCVTYKEVVENYKDDILQDGYHSRPGIRISYENMVIDGKFYFGEKEQLDHMKEIIDYGKTLKKEDKTFEVKNGFATLADDVFIGANIPDPADISTKRDYIITAYKSSTGQAGPAIYPYENGKLISEEKLKEGSPNEYEWLMKNKDKLLARSTTEPWYAFGRTQAINDVEKEKYAVSSLVRRAEDLKLVKVAKGEGVYGGLYVLAKNVKDDVKGYLQSVLKNYDFISYVKMLRKYKSGGYYTFSSKELENYLNWIWKETKLMFT